MNSACEIKRLRYPALQAGEVSFVEILSTESLSPVKMQGQLIKSIKTLMRSPLVDSSGQRSVVEDDDIKNLLVRCLANNQISEISKKVVKNTLNILDTILHTAQQKMVSVKDAQMQYKHTEMFIPVISKQLNSAIFYRFSSDISKIAIYNGQSLSDPSNLYSSIMQYKNELFYILQEFCGINPGTPKNLYNLNKTVNTFLYKEVMEKAWEKIQSLKNPQTGVYDAVLNPETNSILEAIKAFYILNNFDDFISQSSHGIISVDTSKYGSLEISGGEGGKYQIIKQTKRSGGFGDNYDDTDSDLNMSKLFNWFIRSIELGNGSYVSIQDFKKLSDYISLDYSEGSDKYAFLFYDSLSTEELKNKLIDTLKTDTVLHSRLGTHGSEICSAIANALNSYFNAYNKKLSSKRTSILTKTSLENKLNFIKAFQMEVKNQRPMTYIQSSEDGVKIVSDVRVGRSKEGIISKLRENLRSSLQQGDTNKFNAYFQYNEAGKNPYSQEFLNWVKSVTGLNISKEILDTYFTDGESFNKLYNFLNTFCEHVLMDLIPVYRKVEGFEDRENELIENFINWLKFNENYLAFSTQLISDNRIRINKLLDQSGNTQPTQGNPNTIQRDADNLRDFKHFAQEYLTADSRTFGQSSNNIRVLFPQLTKPLDKTVDGKYKANGYIDHIGFRQDVSYIDQYGNKQVIKAVEMTPSATLYTAFNNEFIDMIVSQGIMATQVDCYSDKVRIALAMFNMQARYQKDGRDKSFYEASNNEIFDWYYNQHKSYYQTVENKLIRDYNKVFGEVSTIEDVVNTVETHTEKQILDAVRKYNTNNPSDIVTFVEQIHYVGNKNKLCNFNNTLWFNITATKDQIKAYFDSGFNEFLENFQNVQIPQKFRNRAFIEKHWNILGALIGEDILSKNKNLIISKLENYFQVDSDEPLYWTDINSEERNNIGKELALKFYSFNALFSESELFISTKTNVIHKGKGQHKISELINNPNYLNIISKDQSERLIVGKKRNNALIASYLPMTLGLTYGVGNRSNVAVVQSKKQDLLNYNGDINEGQDVNDGALWTVGVAARWENLSWPTKHVYGTKKVIGLVPTVDTNEQFKTADFQLDNFLLNKAFDSNDPNAQHLMNRARKMLLPGKFTQKFRTAFMNPNMRSPIGYDIIRKINGDLYALSSLKYDTNTNQLQLTWASNESGEIFDGNINNVTYIEDKNLDAYHLWQAFGGIDSYDTQGNIANTSMDAVADLISEYDPDVKDFIIHKIVDVSSNKSGITNLNYLEDVDDKTTELNYHSIDNSRWGMQQDYSHESDESDIPSLTQVISAIALNGKNIKLVGDVYKVLERITLYNLEKENIQWIPGHKSIQKLNQDLAEDLIRSLAGRGGISDAINIAARVLQRHLTDKTAQLPYSDPNIFYKVASNIITGLDNNYIRQKYSGVAIIQNPSHSMIGLIEDNLGNVYTKQDLAKMGEIRFKNNHEIVPDGVNLDSDYFARYEAHNNSNFNNILVNSLDELEPEDTVQISTINKKGEQVVQETIRIQHPSQLLALEKYFKPDSNYVVEKIFRDRNDSRLIQRDLKAPRVSYVTNDGQRHSFWTSLAVRARINPKQYKLSKYEALEFYRATLNGLGDSNPYYYLTYDDYLKGESGRTYLQSVSFEPGEQILPKVNRTAQGLGDLSLQQILEQREEYFKDQAEAKLLQSDKLVRSVESITNSKYKITVVRNTDELLYSTKEDIVISDNIVSDEDGLFWYQDNFGKKLFIVPSKYVEVSNSKNELGKDIYTIYERSSRVNPKDIKSCLYKLNGVNAAYNYGDESFNNTIAKINPFIDTTKDINEEILKYSKKLYNSFNLSNYTVSARIPSQSFQSFMANKTVAFMELGSNDGYVNIHEVWFTGSDYDIKYY